jgi:hypothetical protein
MDDCNVREEYVASDLAETNKEKLENDPSVDSDFLELKKLRYL